MANSFSLPSPLLAKWSTSRYNSNRSSLSVLQEEKEVCRRRANRETGRQRNLHFSIRIEFNSSSKFTIEKTLLACNQSGSKVTFVRLDVSQLLLFISFAGSTMVLIKPQICSSLHLPQPQLIHFKRANRLESKLSRRVMLFKFLVFFFFLLLLLLYSLWPCEHGLALKLSQAKINFCCLQFSYYNYFFVIPIYCLYFSLLLLSCATIQLFSLSLWLASSAFKQQQKE